MPKRLHPICCDNGNKNKPSKRTKTTMGNLDGGECIIDNSGNQWTLGKIIGIGGFGEIYDVTDQSSSYVAKIEKHSNGPLFVEINCYLRLLKLEMIQQWQQEKNIKFLGVPHFVASGSCLSSEERYRFLIIPKYDKDLESIFQQKKRLNIKTVLVLATRLVDTLEYIHDHGYVHSDVKASNIMLKYNKQETAPVQKTGSDRKLRTRTDICYKETLTPIKHTKERLYITRARTRNITKSEINATMTNSNNNNNNNFEGDHVYLLDYGLASKYLRSNGQHREFADERKAHAGTILFCSRDAHKGISSRRSDLESLAYNMVYWLTGSLPWIDDGCNPEIIERKKNLCFANTDAFLCNCFKKSPKFLNQVFKYLSKLEYNGKPNYDFLRGIFRTAIKKYGYTDDSKLDFDNSTKSKLKLFKVAKDKIKANILAYKKLSFLYSKRVPHNSNFIFKRANLRKNKQKMNGSGMHWSDILIDDPETMLKNQHRKTPEEEKNILTLDIESLNPTPTMREVFARAVEKQDSLLNNNGDQKYLTKVRKLGNIKGYTPEMLRIHTKMLKEQKLQTTRKSRKKITSKTKDGNGEKQRNTRHVELRKAENIPLKRTYSLRG